MKKDDQARWERLWYVWVFGLPTVCISLYFGVIYWFIEPIEVYSISNSALLGDSFGIVTSWFSGMAFCAAIYLILVQRREFKGLRDHGTMMARIERASFQPFFKISGNFRSEGKHRDDRKLIISIENPTENRFFIFKKASFLRTPPSNYNVVPTSRMISVELLNPIDREDDLVFLYADLSGYITRVTFVIRVGIIHGHNPPDGPTALSYSGSEIKTIEFLETDDISEI